MRLGFRPHQLACQIVAFVQNQAYAAIIPAAGRGGRGSRKDYYDYFVCCWLCGTRAQGQHVSVRYAGFFTLYILDSRALPKRRTIPKVGGVSCGRTSTYINTLCCMLQGLPCLLARPARPGHQQANCNLGIGTLGGGCTYACLRCSCAACVCSSLCIPAGRMDFCADSCGERVVCMHVFIYACIHIFMYSCLRHRTGAWTHAGSILSWLSCQLPVMHDLRSIACMQVHKQ